MADHDSRRCDRAVLMRRATASEAMDCLDEAACCCDPMILARLWDSVPRELRLSRWVEETLPDQYRGAITEGDGGRNAIDLSAVPEPMRRELTWCLFRIVDLGGKIPMSPAAQLTRRLSEVVADLGAQAPSSLMDLPARAWCEQIPLAYYRRMGRLPGTGSIERMRELLLRCLRLLGIAYDQRPWWQRELWDPTEDPRIPMRPHEPLGRQAARFSRIHTPWLRHGLQWHCKIGLETGAMAWTTALQRVGLIGAFDAFLVGRDIPGPYLADDPAEVRTLMLDFLGHVRSSRATTGPAKGQLLSASHTKNLASAVEQFYLFMHDNKDTAAAALAEPSWLRLGHEHAGFYRRGELPRVPRRDVDLDVIDDTTLTKVMAGIGLLGDPVDQGGLGDEQVMRIMMLQARLGRRINEICMLDREPLVPLNLPHGPQTPEPGVFTARLRYQQTKIDDAPDTVLVDDEVLAIINAQREWADRYFAEYGAPGRTPKYLFLGEMLNRNGDRPYAASTLGNKLTKLARRLDIRDSTGRGVDFQRTHRFRHTRATSLLNAGVPLHVVQRYLGHLSPTMTMHYAQTLAATHEAEFLRYRKVSADARDLPMDPRDLYDVLELDKRTDRILPNGWCLLPPRQPCDKGNACLTCDKFTTDASFLPELQAQQHRTARLIDERREAFKARTGQEMSPDNVWLAGRLQEHDALGRIIVKIEQTRPADDTVQAVRGAGVTARTDAITRGQDRKA